MTERNKVSHKITSSPKIVVCASGSSMIHATARQNSIGKRILRILIFNCLSPFMPPYCAAADRHPIRTPTHLTTFCGGIQISEDAYTVKNRLSL